MSKFYNASGLPSVPPGKSQHHIVVLEAVHAPMPSFEFPHTITLHQRTQPHQVAERIRDATIVIGTVTPVTPADMDQAPYLGCLSVMAVGIGWVDREDCARRGVTVTNCPAGNVDAVCEHFFGLYFASRKRLIEVHDAVVSSSEWLDHGTMRQRWGSAGPPFGCAQECLGILGYGNLGRRIEELARALRFGEVLVAERKDRTKDEVRKGRISFAEVLRRASTIAVCVPKGEDTIDLIGEEEIAMMRKEVLIINVARGGIVNETALAKALKEGRIAGAATDVLEDEPGGPGTSPLLPDMSKGDEPVPNLTISAHNAWFTQSTIANYQHMLKHGIEGWVTGKLDDEKIKPLVVVHDGTVWR